MIFQNERAALHSHGLEFHPRVLLCASMTGTAPFSIKASSTTTTMDTGDWRNYTIQATPGYEMFVQTTDGSPITQYNDGICGSPPNPVGHGLCQKCATSMFAMNYDCTSDTCTFGVSAGKGKVSVLVGTSAGISVTAVEFSL